MFVKAGLFVGVFSLAMGFDYCTISSQNTLCKYKPTEIGKACTETYPINLTDADKATILSIHNELRRKVAKGSESRGAPGPQPPASNMRQLKWDDELATMAQTLVQQCIFGHDANRNVARFPVGQNLAIQFSTGKFKAADWSSQIKSWFDEVTAMDRTYVSSFPAVATKGVVGHYTQTVWAESYLVGCGIMSYYDTSFQGTYPYKLYYACNYGPAGNYIGEKVYQSGTAASDCPKGSTASDGLCV